MSRRAGEDRDRSLVDPDVWLEERRPRLAPGKRTLTQRLPSVQRAPADAAAHRARLDNAWRSALGSGPTAGGEDVQQIADRGVEGPGADLPHFDAIQQAFGPAHDLGSVRAHVGGAAGEATKAMGARAYATGNDVAFDGAPDLHTAAHEATHVVQQRQGVHLAGGVGQAGDPYEQEADRVADAVVRGESVAHLLPAPAPEGGRAVQRQDEDSVSYAARARSEAADQERGAEPDMQEEMDRAERVLQRAERTAIPLHIAGRDNVDPDTAREGGQLLARAAQLASESVVRARQQLQPGDPRSVALSSRVAVVEGQLARLALEHGPALGIHRFRGEAVVGALYTATGDPAADVAREVRRLDPPLRFVQRAQAAEGGALRTLAAELPELRARLDPGQRAFLDHVLEVVSVQARMRGIRLGAAEQGVDRLSDFGGLPAELNPAIKQRLPMQLTDDVLASLNRCSPHIAVALEEEWDALRDAWYIAAGFLGAELISIALVAQPSPHLKVVGAIVQAIMVALAIQGLPDAIGELRGTVHDALAWYHTIRSADGNSAKINLAAAHLGRVAAKVLLAILKALPFGRLLGRRKARQLGEGHSAPEARTHRDGLDTDDSHSRPDGDSDADTRSHRADSVRDSDSGRQPDEGAASPPAGDASAEADLARRRHAEEAQRRREAAAEEEPDTRTTHEKREDERREARRERQDELRNKTKDDLGVSDEGANALATLNRIKHDPIGPNTQTGRNYHYDAARREAAGEVVARRPDGRPYSHISDLQQARDALKNVERILVRERNRPGLTERGQRTVADRYKETKHLLEKLNAFLASIGHERTPPYHRFPDGGGRGPDGPNG